MERDDLELTAYRNRQVSDDEINSLETLLEASPEDLQILDWVAFAHYCRGGYDRAVELYRRCIDLEPQTASYYYFLGNALYKQSKEREAVEAWEMASSLDRQGPFRKKAEERLAHVRSR